MTDEGERIAKLETRLDHLTETIEKTASKVDDLHNLMMQAKGARWAIISVAAVAGFLSAKLAGIVSAFKF